MVSISFKFNMRWFSLQSLFYKYVVALTPTPTLSLSIRTIISSTFLRLTTLTAVWYFLVWVPGEMSIGKVSSGLVAAIAMLRRLQKGEHTLLALSVRNYHFLYFSIQLLWRFCSCNLCNRHDEKYIQGKLVECLGLLHSCRPRCAGIKLPIKEIPRKRSLNWPNKHTKD